MPPIYADERRSAKRSFYIQTWRVDEESDRRFFEVYNELGFGFLETVYEKALVIALKSSGLAVETQVPVPVWFRGQVIGEFAADVMVSGVVLLELKALQALVSAHEAQLLHYLRATTVEVGLLLNFGPKPQFKRLAFENERKKILPQIYADERR